VLNDAAADVPPSEQHLQSIAKMGVDLVAFSGGKGNRADRRAPGCCSVARI
jgi:hypothetical protein